LPRPVVVEWVRRAAVAVTNYLGRYPVKELSLTVEPGGHGPVNHGVTHAASRIEVRLGPRAEAADLNGDWILTHEMFHLAFPTLEGRYLWMMEGLSDYLEPVARGRAGQLTPEEVWRKFVEGFPQGQLGPQRRHPHRHHFRPSSRHVDGPSLHDFENSLMVWHLGSAYPLGPNPIEGSILHFQEHALQSGGLASSNEECIAAPRCAWAAVIHG
jgi:hypothetical protein